MTSRAQSSITSPASTRPCDAGDVRAEALALEGLAGVASLRGDDEGLGRYLGAAAALREATGGPVVGAERVDIERALERVGDRAVMDAAFAPVAPTRSVV